MDKKPLLLGCGALIVAAVIGVIVFGGWAASVNNSLVALQEQMKASWRRSKPFCSGARPDPQPGRDREGLCPA